MTIHRCVQKIGPAWLVLLCAPAGLPQPAADVRVDVNLVRVPCSVTDKNGAAVRGLRKDEFSVLEDGVPRKVEYLWQESDLPITVGVVADISALKRRQLDQHQETIMRFAKHVLAPTDRAFLVSVDTQQRLMAELSSSAESLRTGVEDLGKRPGAILGDACASGSRGTGCGCAALWNGVYFAARLKLRSQAGPKALILLTDGWDTGSDHSLVDAIEASQGADAVVYSLRPQTEWILLGSYWKVKERPETRNPLRTLVDVGWGSVTQPTRTWIAGELAKGRSDLERISQETGGLAFEESPGKLSEVFDRIESDLRSQYVLGYIAHATGPRRYRKIQVKVTRAGLRVRARQGYYPN